MNWGFRIPLSDSRRQSLHGAATVPEPRRRRLMLLVAASLAACALAQATPALGATASIAPQSFAEGDAGTTIVNVLVSLDAPAAGGETVDVATLGTGSATASADYTAFAAATATFPMNATSATVPLTIVGETVFEADETIVLQLSSPTAGLAILVPEGTITITNDDVAPTLAISGQAVAEGTEIGRASCRERVYSSV